MPPDRVQYRVVPLNLLKRGDLRQAILYSEKNAQHSASFDTLHGLNDSGLVLYSFLLKLLYSVQQMMSACIEGRNNERGTISSAWRKKMLFGERTPSRKEKPEEHSWVGGVCPV